MLRWARVNRVHFPSITGGKCKGKNNPYLSHRSSFSLTLKPCKRNLEIETSEGPYMHAINLHQLSRLTSFFSSSSPLSLFSHHRCARIAIPHTNLLSMTSVCRFPRVISSRCQFVTQSLTRNMLGEWLSFSQSLYNRGWERKKQEEKRDGSSRTLYLNQDLHGMELSPIHSRYELFFPLTF